jgi:hypothetical protein
MSKEVRMGDGVSWIAYVFKLFDALISPRRLPKPDQSVATAAGEGPAPEAAAGESAASRLRLELASEVDALTPQDDSKIETAPAGQIEGPLVQMDDESRRELIRQLFNEYWAGVEDKPPTFAERLEIAERYINDRLADSEVGWTLDAVTRKQLGLPPSSIAG